MTPIYRIATALVIAGLLAFGCSRTASLNPPTTADLPDPEVAAAQLPPDTKEMGAWLLTMEPDGSKVTLDPYQREAQDFGDTFAVDASDFFNFAPCGDCLKVDGFGVSSSGQLYVDYSIRHPYDLPNPLQPKSADRLDLHVFDVQGVFMFKDGQSSGTSSFAKLSTLGVGDGGPQTLAIDNSGFLAGITLDGFTGAYDVYTDSFYPTQTSLHPYVIMREDTSPGNFDPDSPTGFTDLGDPQGHNVLPMGGGPYLKRVYFDPYTSDKPIEALLMLFVHAGIGSEGRGSALGQRMNPVYYLPEYNMKAPWRVRVQEQSNNLEEGDPTSEAVLQVEIYDWQQQVPSNKIIGDLTVDPATPRDHMKRSSKVVDVRAQALSVANPEHVISTFSGGNGFIGDPLLWEVRVPNGLDANEGTYMGLIEVVDELDLYPSEPGGLARDGRTGFGLGRTSTFWPFTVAVAPNGNAPSTMGSGSSVFGGTGGGGSENLPSELTYSGRSDGAFVAFSPTSSLNMIVGSAEASGRQDLQGKDILLAQSTNWGSSWSQLLTLGDAASRQGDQQDPAMAVGPNNEMYVVFQTRSTTHPETGRMIALRTSTNLGTSWSPVRTVFDAGNQILSDPSVAVTGAGRVVVAWQHPNPKKVSISYSDNQGLEWVRRWEEQATASLRDIQVVPSPSSQSANGFSLLTVQEFTATRSEAATYHYPYGNNTLWARIDVFAEPLASSIVEAKMSYCETSGDLLVAFRLNTGLSSAIYTARKAWAATTYQTPIKISSGLLNNVEHPTVIFRRNGSALVAWSDASGLLSGHDIYLASLSTDGVWSESWKLDGRPGNQRWPQLFLNDDTQAAFMAWWDDTQGTKPRGLQFAVEPLD